MNECSLMDGWDACPSAPHGRDVMDVIRPPDGRVTGRVVLGDEEDGTCPHP
jgi:hypothetical protein